jgi:hypothetical protein
MEKDETYGLPPVLDVEDIRRFLGIGKVQAYELVNSGKFHSVRCNRRIKVPRAEFLAWFCGTKD